MNNKSIKLILVNNEELSVEKVIENINKEGNTTLKIYINNFDQDLNALYELFTDENCATIKIVTIETLDSDKTVETTDTLVGYILSTSGISKIYNERMISVSLTK